MRGARVAIGLRGTYVNFGPRGFRYLVDGTASGVTEVAPVALLHEIRQRANRSNLFKVYVWVAGIIVLVAVSSPFLFLCFFILACAGGFFVRRWRD